MQVFVGLHDVLKLKVKEDLLEKINKKHLPVELPEKADVYALLDLIGLDRSLVGLIIVNKKQADFSYILADGDIIELFSPMSGG